MKLDDCISLSKTILTEIFMQKTITPIDNTVYIERNYDQIKLKIPSIIH